MRMLMLGVLNEMSNSSSASAEFVATMLDTEIQELYSAYMSGELIISFDACFNFDRRTL